MKRFFLLAMLITSPLFAEPISREVRALVLAIAEEEGVPRSVADQLHIEESGDWRTGTWGDAGAVGPEGADGMRCRGLYQLNPRWQPYLVGLYFPHPADSFDVFDPVSNARVALAYLSALHRRFENWTQALWFYNSGRWRREDVPESTRAYAERIVNAKEPTE